MSKLLERGCHPTFDWKGLAFEQLQVLEALLRVTSGEIADELWDQVLFLVPFEKQLTITLDGKDVHANTLELHE